jgi:hypothetical protein
VSICTLETMKRPTLFLGGSLHGKRFSVAGEPDRYDYKLPESRGIRTMINGCQGFDPKRKPLVETYQRVENEAVGVFYLLEGYEPTIEDEGLVG